MIAMLVHWTVDSYNVHIVMRNTFKGKAYLIDLQIQPLRPPREDLCAVINITTQGQCKGGGIQCHALAN